MSVSSVNPWLPFHERTRPYASYSKPEADYLNIPLKHHYHVTLTILLLKPCNTENFTCSQGKMSLICILKQVREIKEFQEHFWPALFLILCYFEQPPLGTGAALHLGIFSKISFLTWCRLGRELLTQIHLFGQMGTFLR